MKSIYIIALGDAARAKISELSTDLRDNGIDTDYSPDSRSLRAQLRDYEASGSNYAMVVDDDALMSGLYTLEGSDGSGCQVPLLEVIKIVSG